MGVKRTSGARVPSTGVHYSLPAAYSTFRLASSGTTRSDSFRVGELELFGTEYKLEVIDIRTSDDEIGIFSQRVFALAEPEPEPASPDRGSAASSR